MSDNSVEFWTRQVIGSLLRAREEQRRGDDIGRNLWLSEALDQLEEYSKVTTDEERHDLFCPARRSEERRVGKEC